MFLLVFLSLFAICSCQNVTLAAMEKVIPNPPCPAITDEFMNNVWNVVTGQEQMDLCQICRFGGPSRCGRFFTHRVHVKQFADFLFGRIAHNLESVLKSDLPGDLSTKLESLFWKIDLLKNNEFLASWEYFKEATTYMVDVPVNQLYLITELLEDELWTFQEINSLHLWNFNEFPDGPSFPFGPEERNRSIRFIDNGEGESYYYEYSA